jgi:hypothetical protein
VQNPQDGNVEIHISICRAEGCNERIPHSKIMCERHERMIPPNVLHALIVAYKTDEPREVKTRLIVEAIRLVGAREARDRRARGIY